MRFVFREPKVIRPSSQFQEPTESGWQIVHRVADANISPMANGYTSAVDLAKLDVRIDEIAEAVAQQNLRQIMQLLGLEAIPANWSGSLTQLLREMVGAAGNQSIDFLPGDAAGLLSFDLNNPLAIEWASTHAAELVNGVSAGSEAAIRLIIRRAFQDGIPPRDAAILIESVIGLTERQATAVFNFRQNLLDGGVSLADAMRRAGDYAARLLRQRGLLIARTETILAANMGQQLLWADAVDAGLFAPSEVKREWIVTPDDRLDRAICLPMAGQQVGLNEPFTTGTGGQVMVPPVHPGCRCGVGLVFV